MKRAAVLTVMLTAAACSTTGDASPAAGVDSGAAETAFPAEGAGVTIVTKVDSSAQLGGTFKIEDGGAALGCSSGMYVDSAWDFGHQKAFTCKTGGMTGTFAVRVHPDSIGVDSGPPETWTGTWGIDSSASTGDFAGLQGFGVFEVVFDSSGRPAVETLSGEIYA